MEKHGSTKAALLVALAGVSWSFAGILGRYASWSALSLAGYRAAIAALLLGMIRKSYRPVNTHWNWIGALGVMLTSLLFMYANKLTSSANAIVLQYASTAVVILLQLLIMKIRPKRVDVVAAAFVMLGVVLCFCQNLGRGRLLGDVIALISAFTWAMVFFAGRMPGVDSLAYTYQGNLLLSIAIIAVPFDPGVRAGGLNSLLAASAMAVCLFAGYFCFSTGMRMKISPVTASIVSNIEPVLNPLWVMLFLHESPGILSICGTAVVLITATLYSLRKN